VAAIAFGFSIFSHAFEGPDLYGASSFFETMLKDDCADAGHNDPPLSQLVYKRPTA